MYSAQEEESETRNWRNLIYAIFGCVAMTIGGVTIHEVFKGYQNYSIRYASLPQSERERVLADIQRAIDTIEQDIQWHEARSSGHAYATCQIHQELHEDILKLSHMKIDLIEKNAPKTLDKMEASR